jgi:uracil-DNA glycosylase
MNNGVGFGHHFLLYIQTGIKQKAKMQCMNKLLLEISNCTICKKHLPFAPRPVLQAGPDAKIIIIGQAPGLKVQQSGKPWADASGKKLREWLGVDEETFYNPAKIALVPMGFCYPGKSLSGDLPPRPECAPQWHQVLLSSMKKVQLIILIGQYAQNYYLGDKAGKNLTETVKSFKKYLPRYFVLPHPSPRNRFWLVQNKWFEKAPLSLLKQKVNTILK